MHFWTHQDRLYMRKDQAIWVVIGDNWKEDPISNELSALIEKEWADEEVASEKRWREKYGPVVKEWDYLEYLDEMERIEGGGKEYPRGDLDPCDWKYETGAACLG